MFIAVIGMITFFGVLLAASLCIIAGHADNMLDEIEREMRAKSLDDIFRKERVS
jgi:hypothetical protein